MRNKFLDGVENSELIALLENSSVKEKINTILLNESVVYTKKGRLNKSGACRILNMKPKELDDFIVECRDIIRASQFED
jgi:hypothetical protein